MDNSNALNFEDLLEVFTEMTEQKFKKQKKVGESNLTSAKKSLEDAPSTEKSINFSASDTEETKKKKRPWRQVVRHRAKRMRMIETENDGLLPVASPILSDCDKKKKKRRKKKKILIEDEASNNDGETVSQANESEIRLEAGRFRFLNEKLYTTTSEEAKAMFDEDNEAFEAYHKGYRLQVKKWPLNPVDKIILDLRTLPTSSVVADVGCGDAKIAQQLGDKLTVYSFDLVASNDRVTVADMSHLPLENETVDVAVYCLSLMGTNLNHFIREANRILKNGGRLKICEVNSRFRSVKKFIQAIEKMGFTLKNKKLLKDYFVVMTFTKIAKTKEKRPLGLILNPCFYKKR